jgi:type I restriction enzyme, S subunit
MRAGSLSDLKTTDICLEMYASPVDLQRYEVVSGDLVVAEGGDCGQTAFVSSVQSPTIIQNSLHRIRSRYCDLRFVRYSLDAVHSTDWLEVLCNKSTFGHLTREKLSALQIPFPPPAAQHAIADYLDRETARIDDLVVAKRRMVELLEERAVTFIEDCALDAGWPQVALSRVIRRIEQGWSPQCDARLPNENEWGVLKVGCVNHGEFRSNETKALPTDLAPRAEYTVRNGDLLIARANTLDLVGSTAIVCGVRPKTLLCDKLYRLQLDERKAVPRFVSLWLQTRAARDQIELEATGASDSMQNVGQDTVRRVAIPLPDLHRQEAFVIRCEREHVHIGKIVGAIRNQIALLQERRQALITTAVTGQLDIPEAA